jgi:predicted double-glycine peptidase
MAVNTVTLSRCVHARRWLLALLCIAICTVPARSAGSQASLIWPNSLEAMRWEGVVRQTTQSNCGPAALATALLMFGEQALPGELYPEGQSTSFAILQRILATRGYISVGLRMTTADLQRYLNEQRLPALAHILVPNPHFTVVTAAAAARITTRDPSLGCLSWEIDDWNQVWTGAALLIGRRGDAAGTHHGQADLESLLAVLALLMRPQTRIPR